MCRITTCDHGQKRSRGDGDPAGIVATKMRPPSNILPLSLFEGSPPNSLNFSLRRQRALWYGAIGLLSPRAFLFEVGFLDHFKSVSKGGESHTLRRGLRIGPSG